MLRCYKVYSLFSLIGWENDINDKFYDTIVHTSLSETTAVLNSSDNNEKEEVKPRISRDDNLKNGVIPAILKPKISLTEAYWASPQDPCLHPLDNLSDPKVQPPMQRQDIKVQHQKNELCCLDILSKKQAIEVDSSELYILAIIWWLSVVYLLASLSSVLVVQCFELWIQWHHVHHFSIGFLAYRFPILTCA